MQKLDDMRRMSRMRRAVWALLLGTCLLAGVGCDEQLTSELAALSGSYLGDVVSVVVTECLQDALGVGAVGDGDADGDDHAHDAGALHEHEH